MCTSALNATKLSTSKYLQGQIWESRGQDHPRLHSEMRPAWATETLSKKEKDVHEIARINFLPPPQNLIKEDNTVFTMTHFWFSCSHRRPGFYSYFLVVHVV